MEFFRQSISHLSKRGVREFYKRHAYNPCVAVKAVNAKPERL